MCYLLFLCNHVWASTPFFQYIATFKFFSLKNLRQILIVHYLLFSKQNEQKQTCFALFKEICGAYVCVPQADVYNTDLLWGL